MVEFSPGYRVYAVWTRLRSLVSVFARYTRYRFLHATFSLDKSFIARYTRLRLFERRFRSVKAFSLMRSTFSLSNSFIALRWLSFRPVIVFSLCGRVFALSHGKRVFDFASDVFSQKVKTSTFFTRFRKMNAFSHLRMTF